MLERPKNWGLVGLRQRVFDALRPSKMLALLVCVQLLLGTGLAGGQDLGGADAVHPALLGEMPEQSVGATSPDELLRSAPSELPGAAPGEPPRSAPSEPLGEAPSEPLGELPGEGSEDSPQGESDDKPDDVCPLDSSPFSGRSFLSIGLDTAAKTPSRGAQLVFGVFRPPRRA